MNLRALIDKALRRNPRQERKAPSSNPDRKKLGLLAIMKNEAMNIREWVDHYRWQGVDKIFLIDNGSTDGGLRLIEQEIGSGYIELFEYPERHQQAEHYRSAFANGEIRRKVEWLIVADLDEFWFSPNSNLRTAIDKVQSFDLIYANWRIFGSDGYQTHPTSLRRCLISRHANLGDDVATKWICRTDAITTPGNLQVHKVTGIDSTRVVSDNVLFHLNHYAIQSVEYFTKVKMTRGDVSTVTYDTVRTLEYFDYYDKLATVADRTLADMLQ